MKKHLLAVLVLLCAFLHGPRHSAAQLTRENPCGRLAKEVLAQQVRAIMSGKSSRSPADLEQMVRGCNLQPGRICRATLRMINMSGLAKEVAALPIPLTCK